MILEREGRDVHDLGQGDREEGYHDVDVEKVREKCSVTWREVREVQKARKGDIRTCRGERESGGRGGGAAGPGEGGSWRK